MVCDRLHRSMHLRVEQRDRIARLTLALGLAARRHLHAQRHRLGGATRHLTAMDPHGVLRRGYSLTMKPDGSLVRSVEAVNAGDAILTRLADGTIGSIVTSGDVSTRNRSKVRRPQPTTADQMDLFNAAR